MSASNRTEKDAFGEVTLEAQCLYGIHTVRGMENFPLSGRLLRDERALVRALAQVKKAAALANREIGLLPTDIAGAIGSACDEIIAGRHHEFFVIDLMEGSGGTSINMNANEVVANRALQLLGVAPGSYWQLHPNDHVNLGQSTNDVVPTALKLAVHEETQPLLAALDGLAAAFAAKAEDFRDVLRLGRTCLQDAQPMTLGQAFGGYAAATARARAALATTAGGLLTVPLGGTAIGTGLGAGPGYRAAALGHLATVTGRPVTGAGDLFDGLQNADQFARVSAELRTVAGLIGKIASDLILLSSGPAGGLGEIRLPVVQAGSSIMPGKVNPVMPMAMQQIAFAVSGSDLAVSMAALGGQLEINHFEPIMASRLFDSLRLLTNGTRLFIERCVEGIRADHERSLDNLLRSSALATAFVPELGYEATATLVRRSLMERRVFTELAVEDGLLAEADIVPSLRRSVGEPACVDKVHDQGPTE